MGRLGLGFGWFLLFLLCAPLIPPVIVARALWRKRHRRLKASRLSFMTTAGRWIFWSVAFVGFEGAALDMFANEYFNAVDEHAATIVFSLMLLALFFVLIGDAALRIAIGLGRTIARF